MEFGLTTQQLFEVYFKRLEYRKGELKGSIEAALHGENPEKFKGYKEVMEKYPNFNWKELEKSPYIMALLDTITANNEALFKALSS